jgi:hypothetical protein
LPGFDILVRFLALKIIFKMTIKTKRFQNKLRLLGTLKWYSKNFKWGNNYLKVKYARIINMGNIRLSM